MLAEVGLEGGQVAAADEDVGDGLMLERGEMGGLGGGRVERDDGGTDEPAGHEQDGEIGGMVVEDEDGIPHADGEIGVKEVGGLMGAGVDLGIREDEALTGFEQDEAFSGGGDFAVQGK